MYDLQKFKRYGVQVRFNIKNHIRQYNVTYVLKDKKCCTYLILVTELNQKNIYLGISVY